MPPRRSSPRSSRPRPASARPSPAAPDAASCRRCGRCCARKIILDDQVVYLPLFCEFFDPRTRLCTVYDRRFESNPRCLTIEEGIEIGVFPADCPLVRDLPAYRPPRQHCTPEELSLYFQHPRKSDDR